MRHAIPIPQAVTALLLLALAAPAQSRDPADPFYDQQSEIERGEFSYDDSQDKPWQESIAEVPPLPADKELLAVRLDALPAGLQAYMAPGTLAYDEQDRVFRYWLIIKSTAGAYNASYEGLRCDVQEYKIYAYGHPRREPQVRANPAAQWQPLGPRDSRNYRREMMITLMCNEARLPRPLADIVATLRGQRAYRTATPDSPDY